MDDIVLKTEKLSFFYTSFSKSNNKAIDDISVSFNRGDLIGIIGHTGSGKSTLIQHFNGLLKPAEGKVYLNGTDIWQDKSKIREVRFSVGLCFQYPEYQLFEETVEKDIAFGPKNMGLSDDEIKERVLESISFVGIGENYLQKSPFDISGGEKRRIAIAGVLAMKPDVLVLDEPCAGLDPIGRNMVLNLIKNYRDTTHSTVIIVSHSMEDVCRIADKVLVLNKGGVAFMGNVADVFSRANELIDMGLDIPEVTQIFLKLKEKGVDIDTNIYTLEQAENELITYLSGRRGHD